MKILYLDPFSGIAGDMTVGALLDAGAHAASLTGALESLATGATFRIEKTKRRGIAATKFNVDVVETKTHRHLPHILDMIQRSQMPDPVKQNAVLVFQKLAEAEAKCHAVPIEKVHFHEVGAVDSICDIAGACMGFHLLGVEEIYSAPINTGSGTVKTEHGVLPVPAPATAELLIGKPVYARGPAMELTTPTGAAIIAALARGVGAMPPMTMLATGHGAGDRDFPENANVLRVILGERTGAKESTTVSVLEANIDDSSPQVLGYTMDRLFDAGALDVTMTPVFMKKSRPGTLLRAIAKPEDRESLAQIIFAETTTLGLRFYDAQRRVKARQITEVETAHGKVRIKSSEDGSFAPEYDDCKELARKTGIPLRLILSEASTVYLSQLNKTR
jgi:uncharacterized protein (TIGR00299 family) protein